MDTLLPSPRPADALREDQAGLAVFLVLLLASGLVLGMARWRLPSIRAA